MSTVGVFSKVGDIMMHVEGYHEHCGGVQYCGGYHPLKFEYHGDIMTHVGDIMSTMGYSNNKRFPPWY